MSESILRPVRNRVGIGVDNHTSSPVAAARWRDLQGFPRELVPQAEVAKMDEENQQERLAGAVIVISDVLGAPTPKQ